METLPPCSTEIQRLRTLWVEGPAVLVQVQAVQGSVPREVGAWMAVFAQQSVGTIGGGHLEWQALALARQHLGQTDWPGTTQRCALGPSLGQCCGGVVELVYRILTPECLAALDQSEAAARIPLALFGGGHVGHAIARAVQPLPFALSWFDSRDGFGDGLETHGVRAEQVEPVQAAVPSLAAGSRVLIMSFSHAEDWDIVAACLQRQRQQSDLPFIGLIGSATKWARFRSRLQARGFSPEECNHITCPIGLPGITGKQPAVIAASVVAQLLAFTPPDPA